jgi:hypothetical protein
MRSLIVFILLTVALVVSCTTPRKSSNQSKAKTPVLRKIKTPVRTTKTQKPKKGNTKGNAVWHLIYPDAVELYLQHANGTTELIKIETKLSDINLTPGTWQVIGIVWAGQEYEALDEGAKFEFTLKPKSSNYVGSYVIQCPKVENQNMGQIRKMEFFNRFQFTSEQGTCEMLVGNGLSKVRKAWSHLQKTKPKNLRLAF